MNATGVVIALAAAGLFTVAGCASESTKVAGSGQCHGVNACKGQSACKTAKSACKGQNACKGQGFMTMTKADCTAAGGKFQSDGGGY